MVSLAGRIPNPLAKLPWNVAKEKAREERRLKQEAALLYRELGVAEDSSFEEIQEATATLLARYENDIKKRVKVEITKDKIMQIRLNQRLSGITKENADAAASIYLAEEAEEFKNQPKEWEAPKWSRGLIVKPNSMWWNNCVIFFGGLAALGIFLPSQAEGLPWMSLMLTAGLMASRGTPPAEPGQGFMRGGKVGGHTFFAFGLSIFSFTVLSSFASLLARTLLAETNTFWFPFQNAFIAISMGLVTSFIQTYKDPNSS